MCVSPDLFPIFEDGVRQLQTKSKVGAVFFYFLKAFDSVSYEPLSQVMLELDEYILSGLLIINGLYKRTQAVLVCCVETQIWTTCSFSVFFKTQSLNYFCFMSISTTLLIYLAIETFLSMFIDDHKTQVLFCCSIAF